MSAVKTPSPNSSFASLETIDFSRLVDKDPAEQLKLLALSVKDGFFYLDLQGPRIKKILEDKENVMRMMEWYFALPLEEKMKDDRHTHTHGYKPPGTFTGFRKGSRDCYETLKVAYAEMVAHSEMLPEAVKERMQLFESFIGLSHFVNKTLLTSLSDVLSLRGPSRFEEHHRNDKPSNTTLVLLHYPQQSLDEGMGHNKHTDIGSLTLLFTKQWGLQLQQPGSDDWSFVAPREGHAIINVGDSLRFLSGKKFNSCLHRVVPVAEDEDRYSIAYFLRPENAVHLEDSEGRRVKAEEWHDQKYVMFGETHEKQSQSSMLTGGMESQLVSIQV
ncbi:2OG-Fe-II oxygenase family oxidoreductase [Pholiota conissans]|uniref:2OG-Fe-II oxygenase family oxidoreductase n=1 Tax=Pholiota conissans TaxID=109636 RepID=A0A9P6CW97_9AGAR|nr:2OG-Fe-II oxygenase family oxidoreductase [Pholiota conissans]